VKTLSPETQVKLVLFLKDYLQGNCITPGYAKRLLMQVEQEYQGQAA